MKIKLGDKDYTIKYNLNAFVKFEEETNKSLFKQETTSDMSAKELRAMIWAGIKEDISIEEVGELIEMGDMERIAKSITESIEESMPKNVGKSGEGK